MFKKMFLSMCFVLLCSSLAMAVPFTVGGGDLEFGGLGFGSYVVTPDVPQSFDLNDGDSTEIDLFDITFTETSAGAGSVNATIDITEPVLGGQTQSGVYAGLSVVGSYNFTTGFINWGDPVDWEFDLGVLTLDLLDIDMTFCDTIYGNTFTVAGLFNFEGDTNYGNPAPVPEPATMLLLGVGLLGLGGASRKQFIKK